MTYSFPVELQIHSLNSTLSHLIWALLVFFTLMRLVILGVLANMKFFASFFKKHVSDFMLFHITIKDLVYRLVDVPGNLAAKYFLFYKPIEHLCRKPRLFRWILIMWADIPLFAHGCNFPTIEFPYQSNDLQS
ncbi:hypothetical protein pdam_00006738 [Pocillopora damicornis]|uniref:Uncharacterized protein n=1 Tax=Pocillopora damicornis TaxID=46731 RepID=A0A3M6UVY0_POCDA|nr:hypothetical protein pdam_00006738 [Pocillopora damicornis]